MTDAELNLLRLQLARQIRIFTAEIEKQSYDNPAVLEYVIQLYGLADSLWLTNV